MKKYIYLAVINMARMENGGSGQAILLRMGLEWGVGPSYLIDIQRLSFQK